MKVIIWSAVFGICGIAIEHGVSITNLEGVALISLVMMADKLVEVF